VIVLLMNAVKGRQIMVQAQRRGMCKGQYAFFTVDILKTDILGTNAWQTNDVYDQEASTAYRALFLLTLRHSNNDPQFKAFEQQVRARAKVPIGAPPLEVNYILFLSSKIKKIPIFQKKIEKNLDFLKI
jgi:hypothetical protein